MGAAAQLEADTGLAARRERCVLHILAVAEDDRPPSSARFRALAKEAERVFGSWTAACHAAGLLLPDVEMPSDKGDLRAWKLLARRRKVIERLRAISKDGIAPSSTMQDALAREAQRVFGSWSLACQEAGLLSRYGRMSLRWNGAVLAVPAQPSSCGPPPGCEEAERIAALAVRFALKHGIGGSGSGETLLKMMKVMYEDGY